MEIRVPPRWQDGGEWTTKGSKIVAAPTLLEIEKVLEKRGSIIIEHRLYRGSSAPERLVIDDFQDFLDYLRNRTRAGDEIWVWSMHDVCREKNRLAAGKMPDPDGKVPVGGPY